MRRENLLESSVVLEVLSQVLHQPTARALVRASCSFADVRILLFEFEVRSAASAGAKVEVLNAVFASLDDFFNQLFSWGGKANAQTVLQELVAFGLHLPQGLEQFAPPFDWLAVVVEVHALFYALNRTVRPVEIGHSLLENVAGNHVLVP